MPIIDGVDVCDTCGQEVCDCDSGMFHSMEPDEFVDPDFNDFTEAAFDDSFHI